jgi:D-alanyl-D-alanine carboxypeptidase
MNKSFSFFSITVDVFAVLLLIALGTLGYFYYNLDLAQKNTAAQLQNTVAVLETTKAEALNNQIQFEGTIALLEDENNALNQKLEEEAERNDEFEDEVKSMRKAVGTLKKLAETDEELLQKYSKVYFLNEHYLPKEVEDIPAKYLWTDTEPQQFHSEAWPFLEDLLEDAADDGIDLRVTSALRTFAEQTNLKQQYKVVYGAGTANQFSADQGYSEHQLGTALDFGEMNTGKSFDGFENTAAYAWLLKNAHKYGFTLSYPQGNTYYVFEPWHWRFVGRDLAEDLRDDNKNFYDVDQRDIDAYLVKLFD